MSVISSLDSKTMDSQETPDDSVLANCGLNGKRKSCNNWVEKPRIQHPLRDVLQSRTCTSPCSDTGLDQPGNQEMISLSAATVGVQFVMTHDCVSCPLGKIPTQWIPS